MTIGPLAIGQPFCPAPTRDGKLSKLWYGASGVTVEDFSVDVIATIGGALTATKGVLELVKAALAAKAKVKDAEANSLLADLYSRLAEVTVQLADVRIEAAKLVEENARLKAELEKKASSAAVAVEYRDEVCYKAGDDTPYCPVCHAKDDKFIPLSKLGAVFADIGGWQCGVCKNTFGVR